MIEGWNQAKIHEELLQKGIRWYFNPPMASHRGAWERMIRSTRKILESLVKEQTGAQRWEPSNSNLWGRKHYQWQTFNCNLWWSKRFWALDPESSFIITSGSFSSTRYFQNRSVVFNAKPSWLQVQYLANVFWNRWKREYLQLSLEQRQKWLRPRRNLSVGDSVLIVNEKTPRSLWPIGRVSEVYPDSSGFVRRVKVITQKSTLDRPVSKLCLLEQVKSSFRDFD